jgi:sodium pump decarboxylase gamma subunit
MFVALNTDWTSEFSTMAEKIFLASAMAIVGVVIVFLILVLIIIAIAIMSRSIHHAAKRLSKPSASAPTTPQVPVQRSVEPEMTFTSDYEQIAVITAAVAAFIAASGEGSRTRSIDTNGGAPYPGFKVRSIRRI